MEIQLKRRTFIKASPLPLWAIVECSFLPTIFASTQDHSKHLNLDVSILNLTEIGEKSVISDHFDQRNIKVIGFGTSGSEITCQLHTDNEYGIHDIRYNRNSGNLEQIVAYEFSRLNTITPFPPLTKADTGKREHLLNDTINTDKPDTVIFTGNIDSAGDFNSITMGFDLARKKGLFTIGVIKVPNGIEKKEDTEVDIALSRLEKHFDSLFIVPDNSVAQKAIETVIKWYLASRPHYLHQFDLTDIKMILGEGRAKIINYSIPEVITPIDFVKDSIVKDIDKRKLKNGLINCHGDGNQPFEKMLEILDCIGEHVDKDGDWCFYITNDAASGVRKPLNISIISTGKYHRENSKYIVKRF
jgi:hypothetical protein